MRQRGGDAEQAVEGDARVPPPVPAEHEFVEITVEMRLAQSVIDTGAPSLQVGEHSVNPGQQHVGCHGADDFGLVRMLLQALVSRPTIADDLRPTPDATPDEPGQRLGGTVFDPRQPDATGASKQGISAAELQRKLGLGSYQTAWSWLTKIRTAMVRPNREPLAGEVEIDESYVGGPEPGQPGRAAEDKAIVAAAVEKRGKSCGRVRLG